MDRGSRCSPALVAATLAVVGVMLSAAPATAELPTGFVERVLISGLDRPTAVAWAPDGRMFLTEKDGKLKVVSPGSSTPSLLLNLADRVNSHHDRGLLGLAVDSDFDNPAHRYVYLLYTRQRTDLVVQDSGDPTVSQLLRVKLSSTYTVTEQTIILGSYSSGPCPGPSNTRDCIPSDGVSHSIGTVRSAPDGSLYVGSGDGANYGGVDPTALRTYDETSLAGKIIRVDRDGRGVAGHPFCPTETDTTTVCTKLWAKGFRNPFRFSLRPGGGLAVGDVGWNQHEELDLITSGGKSYGWPCYEARIQTPGYRDLAACKAEYAKPAGTHTAPDLDYPHSTGRTIIAGPTYTGTHFPPGYDGSIFYGDYTAGFLKRATATGPGGALVGQSFQTPWEGVAIEQTPTGRLAYVTMGDFQDGSGSVREIAYQPGNRAPVANAAATPSAGAAPLEVQLSSEGSRDADGDALSYSWNFGDGSPPSSAPDPSHTFPAGEYDVTLTVSDGRGLSDTDTVRVSSNNTPPKPVITAPLNYRDGAPLSLVGSAQDDQDGDLPASALAWNVRLQHGAHFHPGPHPSGVKQFSFVTSTDHDTDSQYVASLTATDSRGLSATTSVTVSPETAQVLLLSDPTGIPMTYLQEDVETPFQRHATIGLKASVSTPQAFERDSRTYAFDSWEDGSRASFREFTVPASGAALTARYRDVTPPAPAPAVSSPVLPTVDTSGPRLSFRKVDTRRASVHGGARDPSGMRSVQVAVGRAVRHGGCRWWLVSQRRLSRTASACTKPRWIRAELSGTPGAPRWRAQLGGRNLLPGGYRLLFRGVDRKGNVGRSLTNGAKIVKVQVAIKPSRR